MLPLAGVQHLKKGREKELVKHQLEKPASAPHISWPGIHKRSRPWPCLLESRSWRLWGVRSSFFKKFLFLFYFYFCCCWRWQPSPPPLLISTSWLAGHDLHGYFFFRGRLGEIWVRGILIGVSWSLLAMTHFGPFGQSADLEGGIGQRAAEWPLVEEEWVPNRTDDDTDWLRMEMDCCPNRTYTACFQVIPTFSGVEVISFACKLLTLVILFSLRKWW